MAAEGSGSFLPLEALGTANGKALTGANSGETNKLAAMTAAAMVYRHSTAVLTSPMQTMTFTMDRLGAKFSADLTAPMPVGSSRGGMTAQLTAPMQIIAATGTVQVYLRAAMTAPMQTIAASGKTGSRWTVALVAPMPVLAMTTGMKGAVVTPMQRITAHVVVAEFCRARLNPPLGVVSGTMSVYSYPMRAALTAPMPLAGPYGIARLIAPMAKIAATLALPLTFEGWVLNVRNNGATRWTNVPFVQFTNVGSDTYGVGSDGNLYLLGGDLDAIVAAPLTPVQWSFETGLDDLGSPGVKHIPYIYLDGIIDGEIQIVLLDDRGREFAYEYDTKARGAVHMTHKRKLGNGIRTRNVGFRLLSTTGAYIELDSLEPEATVTQRSVGGS
jgi:hypothetical protein